MIEPSAAILLQCHVRETLILKDYIGLRSMGWGRDGFRPFEIFSHIQNQEAGRPEDIVAGIIERTGPFHDPEFRREYQHLINPRFWGEGTSTGNFLNQAIDIRKAATWVSSRQGLDIVTNDSILRAYHEINTPPVTRLTLMQECCDDMLRIADELSK